MSSRRCDRKGAYVTGAGAYTSGPLSFMDIYDKMCFTVSSAGGRRGAQMGTFDVGHPDVMEFIRAKREDGRLRQFNLSLLVTDEFMQAVINEDDWKLAFPVTQKEVEVDGLDIRMRRSSSGASGRKRATTLPTTKVWLPARSTRRCRRAGSGTSSWHRPTISQSLALC